MYPHPNLIKSLFTNSLRSQGGVSFLESMKASERKILQIQQQKKIWRFCSGVTAVLLGSVASVAGAQTMNGGIASEDPLSLLPYGGTIGLAGLLFWFLKKEKEARNEERQERLKSQRETKELYERYLTAQKEVLSYYKNIPVVLMHIQGTPKNMQKNPSYKDPVDDILDFFEKRLSFCVRYGIELDRIIIDPGIGFGKKFIHNIEIIKRIGEFHKLGLPVMIGASRKSFLNKIFTSQPQERLAGTLATTCIALRNNVGIVRVHDVKENRQFIDTSYTITQHPS